MRSYIYFIYYNYFCFILQNNIEGIFISNILPPTDCNLFYCNSIAVIYFGQLFIDYIALIFPLLQQYLFTLLLKIINFFLRHLMESCSGFAFRSN